MGINYECNMCGTTEKGYWGCNCGSKINQTSMKKMEGATILESVIVEDCFGSSLLQKLQKESHIFYMKSVLSFNAGIPQALIEEVTELDYTNLVEELK